MNSSGKASDDKAFMADVMRRLEDHRTLCPARALGQVDIVDAFLAALQRLGDHHADAFRQAAHQRTPGARAEAVTWQIFRQLGCQVLRHEIPGRGGPDFVVRLSDGSNLLVESTSLLDETIQAATGLDPERWTQMQYIDSANTSFRNTIAGKVKQISKANFQGPRLLVIGFHGGNGASGPGHVAQDLVAETTHVQVTYGGSPEGIRQVGSLDASAWYQVDDAKIGIAQARQTISAVLLAEMSERQVSLTGLVNPHARFPFDPNHLPTIPWLTVANDPVREHAVRTDWVWLDTSKPSLMPDRMERDLMFDADAPYPDLLDYVQQGENDRPARGAPEPGTSRRSP